MRRKRGRMIDLSKIDYSAFDRWEIGKVLFFPRPEWTSMPMNLSISYETISIPVEEDINIGGRFYEDGKDSPNILFFHGNGEIVADYDDIAQLFVRNGINFLAVDYRGYGQSNGIPTVTNMMRDSHVIFEFIQRWLTDHQCSGPFIVMGRSLGSAAALEIASNYRQRIDGLIVESGFAFVGPLLQLMGLNLQFLGLSEAEGPRNIDKIKSFDKPTLIIHAEFDQIISFSEGETLYRESPAVEKTLLKIPMANHNDIFFQGITAYMEAVKLFAKACMISRQASS
jgi:pimeloyl-ACP methyl ester carboxylesterase